ncbi:8326_t:CDS:2, partial [Diversispora eburnea]
MANTQSKVDSLEEQNSKLVAEITELKREKAEFVAKESGFIARITELEQTLKDYEARFVNLEQKDNEKTIYMVKIDGEIKEIKQSSVNTTPISEQIENRLDITDNTSNSDKPNNALASDNTLNSDVCQSRVSDSPLTQCSALPIHTEPITLEDKEIDKFLDSTYREQVSKEIIQSIKEKKLRDENLSSDNSHSVTASSNLLEQPTLS